MSFIWPMMLFSLLLVPVCGLLYWRLQVRRQRYAANLGALGLVRDSAARPLGRRRHLHTILYLTGLSMLSLAMARPELVVSLPRIEGTVILAFDVSASMAADDLEPNRMEAAKEAAAAFIEQQPGNIKIGVVAFSDGGLVVQTPTDDRAALSETINRLVPQSGTSLGQGILVALNASLADPDPESNSNTQGLPQSEPVLQGTFVPVVIVLLTDGENTDAPDPLEAAQVAIEQGVRIYTVGIGSREGTTVEIDGFNVYTQLNEGLLKQIAQMTEGEYFNAANEDDLREIYENLDLQFVVKPEKMEITSLLAGLSFLVLLVGGGLSLAWFGRLP
jgi:Ca-activated chloride channel family protein